MTKGLHVPSEIGKLRKVCLHRPGDELLNLPPDELERLLFDDVPFLEVAQQEHDTFAQILRDQGVEVLSLSYTHLRAHETGRNLVCRLLLEKKKKKKKTKAYN